MDMKELLNFIEEIERLKFIPRSGWIYYGIKNPESVAEHSFMVSILSLMVSLMLIKKGENVNLKKVLIMSLIHEFGEVKIGDIHLIAKQYLGFDVVDNAERGATFELLEHLNLNELKEIYNEFLENETAEAKIVKACDKLELLIQARIYKKIGYNNLDEFFRVKEHLNDIKAIEMLDELIEEIIGNNYS